MGSIRDAFNNAWRDYVTDGVPASGKFTPEKVGVRRIGEIIDSELDGKVGAEAFARQAAVSALSGRVDLVEIGVAVSYETRVQLFADLSHAAGAIGHVIGDSTEAFRGVYKKSGASGSGSWTRIGPLPMVTTPASITAPGLMMPADVSSLDTFSAVEDLVYIGSGLVVPSAIAPNGVVISGIDRSTGLPLVGGSGGASTIDRSLIYITRAVDTLYIHFPQANAQFMRWSLARRTSAGNNSDVWQVIGVHAALLAGGVSTPIAQIVDGGQLEIALRRQADTGFSIGGNAHGNDVMLATPIMLIDGVAANINTGPSLFTCKSLEIVQRSQMYDANGATLFCKRSTRWVFADGGLVLDNYLDDIETAIAFHTMYLAMLPVVRAGGITHSGFRSPRCYPVEDFSGEHTQVLTGASRLAVWGNNYSAEVEMLDGWDSNVGRSWVSSSLDRNKLYFSPPGLNANFTPAPGSTMHARSRMRVSLKG